MNNLDSIQNLTKQLIKSTEILVSEKDKERFRTIDIQLDNQKDAIYKISDYDYPDNPAPENEIKTGADFYQEDVDRRPLIGKHPIDGREYVYFMVPYIVGAFENGERINHKALYDELWQKIFKSTIRQNNYPVLDV